MSGGLLIIGANQAGVQLAASVRDQGYRESVTLVGAETMLPYQRPPLSKKYLSGKAEFSSLAFRTRGFYEQNDITLVAGERVVQVALDRSSGDGSGTAATESGRVFDFSRLALTVGARPRRLTAPGADLAGVCYLRDWNDAVRLRDELTRATSVVVIGGGFIGLEAGAAARSAGRDVTVVEQGERLIARALAPEVSEFYRTAHERRGTKIRLNCGLAELEGRAGRIQAVHLTDGSVLPADLVVVGVGVVARTELADQLGLTCSGGIDVDEFACTSIPGVVAAGDCTTCPDPQSGTGRVHLESVQNAVSQAKVAAATVLGRREPYRDVPWFWSDQYDLKLQIAGLNTGYDQVVIRGDRGADRFSALYYRAGALVAADSVNSPADYLAVRKALSQGATIPARAAANTDVALKQLIEDRALSA